MLLVLAWLLLPASAAAADRYRITPGDHVVVVISGVEKPIETMVDADGEIRMSDLGGVSVSGLTLDEAELRIETEMQSQGLFVEPQVSLTIEKYAPIIVAGDVASPGRYDYLPGMNVAAALALSGGSQTGGVTRVEVARARSVASAGLQQANIDIAATVAKLARVRAAQAGADSEVVLPSDLESLVPLPNAVNLAQMVSNEAQTLRTERARTETLLKFWEEEIATITNQIRNFDARIVVQKEIAENLATVLQDALTLQERGLQTSSRVADATEREAAARSRVLELQTARLNAERAIASAMRERATYLSKIEQDLIDERNELVADLDGFLVQYDRFAEQRALLTGGQAGALLDRDAVAVDFSLLSPRADRGRDLELAPDTPIYPGETLIVSVTPLDDLPEE